MTLRCSVPSLLLLFSLLLTGPALHAQDTPPGGDEPPVQEGGEDETATETPAAPETFDPLWQEMMTLVRKLREQGTVNSRNWPEIRDLRDRVAAFNEQRTPTEQSVAVEAQLALWGSQPEHMTKLLDRLERLDPEAPGLRIMWADLLMNESRYAEAIRVLDDEPIDLAKFPIAALIRADALLADGYYTDAVSTLQAIPGGFGFEDDNLRRFQKVRRESKELAELWPKEQEIRSAEAAADDLPRVEIITSRGRVVVELFENEAPNTVANFISLVEKDYYDGTKFHRVIPNFMSQGGDPNTKEGETGAPGTGGPGYTIDDEFPEGFRRHFVGTLSMANSGPNTGGSQFFLTHRPTPHLDERHTVFGRIIEGLDVVRSMRSDDELISATVLRKRDHPYEPEVTQQTPPPGQPSGGNGSGDQGGSDQDEA